MSLVGEQVNKKVRAIILELTEEINDNIRGFLEGEYNENALRQAMTASTTIRALIHGLNIMEL